MLKMKSKVKKVKDLDQLLKDIEVKKAALKKIVDELNKKRINNKTLY